VPDLPWRWHEYGSYVGPIFLAALVAGVVGAPRRAWAWLLGALVLGATALGDHGPASPWTLLHRLPVGEVLRASGRLLQPALLCAGLAAAAGIDRWGRWAVLAPVLLALDLWLVGPPVLADAFPIPLEAPARGPFVQVLDRGHSDTLIRAHYTTMTLDVLANRGILACYEPARPDVGARVRHPEHEVFVTGSTGHAAITDWAPGRVEVTLVGVEDDGTVVLNENAAPGWRSDVDGTPREIAPDAGRVAVAVGPGTTRVVFTHHSPHLLVGLGTTLATLLVLGVLARREGRGSPVAAGRAGRTV
jgi:hypothetical protein